MPPPVQPEPRWPALSGVLLILILQLNLKENLTPGPGWILPSLEALLLVVLLLGAPHRHRDEALWSRLLSLLLVLLVNFANVYHLWQLISLLLQHHTLNGSGLLGSGLMVWLANTLVFALWYWELDGGGPVHRQGGQPRDLLFPNDTVSAGVGFRPQFWDYLYVSFTNALAFSPTDTLPLSTPMRMFMLVQSLISVLCVVLLVGRAVNIL